MAGLLVEENHKERYYPLTGDPAIAIVGRERTCFVVVKDDAASRKHCRIFRGDGSYNIEDLSSHNGTYVNEIQVVGRRPLRNGDIIRIGQVRLHFSAGFSLGGTVSWILASPLFWRLILLVAVAAAITGIYYGLTRLGEIAKQRRDEPAIVK